VPRCCCLTPPQALLSLPVAQVGGGIMSAAIVEATGVSRSRLQ
jgi:hypothetical protein